MERFIALLLFILQCIYVTSGARLPDVRGSKLEEEIIKSRNPRVIGGTTTTITTTLSTSTMCYTTAGTVTADCDRKKRAISDLPIKGYDEEESNFVLPTSRKNMSEEEEAEQYIIDTLQSQKEFEGMDLNQIKEISQAGRVKKSEDSAEKSRQPRFIDFLYLYTSSITETSTVYSKTFTLTITDCKPAAGLTGLVPSSCAAG